MNRSTVSVHIVTYNSECDIANCINAVLLQNYPIQQIVVVDNASSDGTIEQVELINAEIKDSGTALHLFRNTDNTGFALAHNAAIDQTDTDYCLVLNPDVTLAPDYVSRLVAVMEANLRIGSATGKLLLKRDSSLVDSTGLRMNRARRAFDRGMEEPAEHWNESGEVFGVSGAAAMYSRRMIEDICVDGEFFDGDFFAYKEDVDVAWRARLYGWTAYYDAEALGYHERGWKPSGRGGKALFIRRISYINRYKMLYKNEPARTLPFTLAVSLPYEIAAHGYMLLKERDLFGAWKLFRKQCRNLRRKRKEIQRIAAERRRVGRSWL